MYSLNQIHKVQLRIPLKKLGINLVYVDTILESNWIVREVEPFLYEICTDNYQTIYVTQVEDYLNEIVQLHNRDLLLGRVWTDEAKVEVIAVHYEYGVQVNDKTIPTSIKHNRENIYDIFS